MSKFGSKWPEDMTMRFVERYAQAECLWNSSSPLYRVRSSRQAAYQRLSQEFGITPTEVKFKIKNLRSTYHQELKRNQLKEGSSSLKWYHFMDDIMMVIGRKTRSTSDTGNSTEKEDDVVETRRITNSNARETPQVPINDNKRNPDEDEPNNNVVAETVQAVPDVTVQDNPTVPITDKSNLTPNQDDDLASGEPHLERSRSSDRIAKRKAEETVEDPTPSKRNPPKHVVCPHHANLAPPVDKQPHGMDCGNFDPYLYSHNRNNGFVPAVTLMSIKREQPAWARNIVQVEQTDADVVASQPRPRVVQPLHPPHPHHHEENEFDIFGRSVALQMQRMSTVTALRTKLKIQTILTEERIRDLLDA